MPDSSDTGPSSTGAGSLAPLPREAWLTLDVIEEADGWSDSSYPCLAETAALALARHPRFLNRQAAEACIVLADDDAVRELNRRYRGKDKATNVLSFPAPSPPPGVPVEGHALGDVVLARETVASEARAQGFAFEAHFQHLVVHGLLHLLGFDHENDTDAEEMEAIEIEILASLGIENPYVQELDSQAP